MTITLFQEETRREVQYSLTKIIGIWALAAIPMGILSWIVFPALSPEPGADLLERA